jgi:hypothetical protein
MTEESHVWFDVAEIGVEGKGWAETLADYDRLPARARGVVRDVIWDLSRHPTGMCAHFATDAPEIRARWRLRNPALAMPRMPASGVSGIDLYADDHDRWRWAGAAREIASQTPDEPLLTTAAPGFRRYRLYLPVGNPVDKVEIGVPRGARFEGLPPRRERPIAYYGTSIAHGYAASRPGMTHVAMLGRRLGQPILNLGFSGQALMEPEIADLLAELDPLIYVLDSVPNMLADLIRERAMPFVRKLRAAHPSTPIVLVEARRYTNSWICQANHEQDVQRAAAFRVAYEQLCEADIDGLTYVPGDHLLGDDGEATMDYSHPSDLGFMRMADVLTPVLGEVIRGA